ncbi:hypothetical protein ERO13_A08G220400v2 [Gossypium hirsutum]|uniref:Uncharacterized protein n=5 Tax=Gossypium TaxID=3633 RepID=A0A2P5XBX3_GOSBA|nr:uncharacterized protein LOC107936293 [Gossypium hirsutum]KAB2071600.1 hypothetical protein ES319_A08G233300v1 [Gossypium barbadense]TYH07740.1 hypothetical protein ES288_A08G258100v1 [Gossypium darwinii]TYI16463.1 hypothetical protein ES332_A08G256800v1 [Gossypium tomentosum]TYJ24155.1 hypothetical protein E1A91_A08G241900v1 [Gossypium mustelinum]KAG4189345.1 hypothetical protein ERO13_A08G220400v2 [Gossypium hirsutum]
MDENKFVVSLMIIFLGFSYLLNSSAAVPVTRCSMPNNKKLLPSSPSAQDVVVQDVMKLSGSEEVIEEGEALNNERMLLASTDYSGPGANKNHDPKTPGTG